MHETTNLENSMLRFLHTADWQIGKPFQFIQDTSKREALRSQRVETVNSLKTIISKHDLEFVIVSGDLFDSFTPDKSTVTKLCGAIGELGVPVYAIPGNHDHAGPGCVWEQEFFKQVQQELAPNFHLLSRPEPVIAEKVILLPCPLTRRHSATDPTEWLRQLPDDLPEDRPRIVIAHGSTQGFSSQGEEDTSPAVNQIDLERVDPAAIDYMALGDWHGTRQINPKAWFSGTPEQDRFAKGENNNPGNVLIVELSGRHSQTSVRMEKTGQINWIDIPEFSLTSDTAIAAFESKMTNLLGQRVQKDLLSIGLTGALSLAAHHQLEQVFEKLESRLIHLRLKRDLLVEPSDEEMQGLINRDDPLIASVAGQLQQNMTTDPDDIHRLALRELYIQVMQAKGGAA